jgi:PmbA protein
METAAKEGKKSTGNANRSSYASAIDIACSNFYIDKSRNSFDDLLANDSDTIIITEFQGLHSGANPISGDFSLAAKGFNITAGKQGTPIKQITAAGNFFKLLMDIEQIGDDLIFGLPSSRGCFGSPSVIVRELSIAGK